MPAKEFQSITKKFEEGDRSMLVEPLDYMMISSMPAEGTNVAGLYQIGKSTVALAAEFKKQVKEAGQDAKLAPTTAQLGGRMNTLHALGLVRPVQMVSGRGAKTWQRTPKGEEVVKQWQKQQS